MFTTQELSILRQALDTITLLGKDAKYIASIQIKIEQELDKAVQSTQPIPEKSPRKK